MQVVCICHYGGDYQDIVVKGHGIMDSHFIACFIITINYDYIYEDNVVVI